MSQLDTRIASKVPFTWKVPWSTIWPSASQTQDTVYQTNQIDVLEMGMEDSHQLSSEMLIHEIVDEMC